MNLIKKFIFIFFFLNTVFAIHAKENNIVIKIDNEIITTQDIKNKILTTLILSKKEINQDNINSLKRRSIENLIQLTIKKIELKKFNFKKDHQQINSYLESVSGNNIQLLKDLFKSNNLDFELFLNEIDTEFKWRKFIFRTFDKKIQISSEEIDQQIKVITQKQEDIIKYNLSEIEILTNNKNLDANIVSQVQNEIKDNGFENAVIKFSIAETSSNKGSLGWINSSVLSKEFLRILDKMEVGEISNPIKKQNKIIFLKLNDKKITYASDINLESLKKEIIQQKKNDMFKLYSNSYLSQLRNSKYIEYFK